MAPGSRAPDSGCCSCCRSTRCRPRESSPYSALSAMAIDPQFITARRRRGLRRDRRRDERSSPSCAHGSTPCAVRRPSTTRRCARSSDGAAPAFAHFQDDRVEARTRARGTLPRVHRGAAWWLDDYALFRALHAHHDERAWTEWPRAGARPVPEALVEASGELADDMLYRKYLQWMAGRAVGARRDARRAVSRFRRPAVHGQRRQRRRLGAAGRVRLDASVGVPPDAFSETGQDWGLPAYRWDVLAERDFDWLRQRARRNARSLRRLSRRSPRRLLSHVLPPARRRRRRVHAGRCRRRRRARRAGAARLREPGAEIIAEDLGIVPDFVRESLARLGVPGYKVFRWERHWHERASRSETRPSTRPRRWRPPARTTPSRWRSGGSTRRPRNGARCWRFRRCASG